MKHQEKKYSLTLIGVLIILGLSYTVVLANIFYIFGPGEKKEGKDNHFWGIVSELKSESGMYVNKDHFEMIKLKSFPGVKKRSLETHYNFRAYHGAPPQIPHPILSTIKAKGNSCLQCHQKGGFVPKLNAFAPISPHPKMHNCQQCHLPKKTTQLFKGTTWRVDKIRKLNRSHLPGSPPVIPHRIQMRENCLSCHGGLGSVEEIRVTHPERINCRQCHVTSETNEEFFRAKK